jgi:hypothetical protein
LSLSRSLVMIGLVSVNLWRLIKDIKCRIKGAVAPLSLVKGGISLVAVGFEDQ